MLKDRYFNSTTSRKFQTFEKFLARINSSIINFLFVFIYLIVASACATSQAEAPKNLKTGAEQTNLYLSDLKGKTVALVVNHTSTIGKTHLADSLIALGIKIKTIFAPEHGFRGTADAGEHVANGIDKIGRAHV